MRYKLTNWMPPSEDGKEIRIESVFDSFEHMVDKIVRDLNSLWKGMLPPNLTTNIMGVPDDTKSGMSLYLDGELIASHGWDDIGSGIDVVEVMHNEIRKYFSKDSKYMQSLTPSGMLDKDSKELLMKLMTTNPYTDKEADDK